PLKAEIVKAGARTEYPAGYEIVRLSDDGAWSGATAGIDKAIGDVIAKFGHGHGSLDLSNRLDLTIDAAQRQAYCVEHKAPDIRVYLEEAGVSALTRLDPGGVDGMFASAVTAACGG